MKNITRFFVLFVLCLSALVSCSKEGQVQQGKKLQITPEALYFTKAAASQTLELKTNASQWNAVVSKNDWLEIDKTSGTGSCDIVVTVSENNKELRTATISFSATGYKTVVVPVTQHPLDELVNPSATGLFSIPELPEPDSPCVLYYRADKNSPFYDYKKDMYAHIGIVEAEWMCVQADWDKNTDKCKWQPCEEKNLWKLPIQPSIREWFASGDTPVNKIGVVVRSADGKLQTDDLFLKVKDDKFVFEPKPVVNEAMPAGAHYGINYNSDGSVTLVLRNLDNKNKRHEYCYLTGEFSKWQRSNDYSMKRDDASGCWWYTMTNVDPNKEYMFQYYLVNKDGSAFRIHDPYTEIVYDGSNDKYISSSTYPDLPAYPKGTSGLVSAFKVNKDVYNWTSTGFKIADQNDLVIYEMHFRDFTSTGDIPGALEKLDYLSSLGINAVELMPIQEFDGNDSWGYNPCSYFALDKAYGTRNMYKQFIDGCHARGMAVIVDVVYNQATGAHPYAKLYWDSKNNKTASNNPWFNVDAPHPYSVFHDWNHEYQPFREHVKESLKYLMEEYHVDGFRFDLTKGFTNKKSDESTASNYDQSRVDILTDYTKSVKSYNPNAVVILEHFCETREEKALAEAGAKVWRNLNNAYCQSAMGKSAGSGFEGLWTGSAMPFGAYVGFMESHDEERTAYKALKEGVSGISGDSNLAARMKREALNAAFFLTVPGPKMLWQFEELGYDISIEKNGRTGKKPVHWEYLENADRKALHDTYASLMKFRKENPRFFSSDADFSWYVSGGNWNDGRFVYCTVDGKAFAVIGNFSLEKKDITAWLPKPGTWKVYPGFGSGSYNVTTDAAGHNSLTVNLDSSDFKLLVLE